MKQSNRGILLVAGIGVACAAGLGAFYAFVVTPRGRESAVREEIERWSSRWAEARACLVGAAAVSPDGLEAVVLRDLTDAGVPRPRACQQAVRALRRELTPESIDAGPELEDAWARLTKRITALAEAHAWRAAPHPNRAPADLRRSLGEAVTALDASHADLRARAGLPVAALAGQRLRVLPDVPAIADAAGRPLQVESVHVGADTVAARAAVDGATWQIRLTGSAALALTPAGPGVLAAIANPAWGVWQGESGALLGGPLDAAGDPASDGVPVAPPGGEALAALGADGVRVVLYGVGPADRPEERREWLARSRDGGATWPEHRPLTPTDGQIVRWHLQPELDRIDLVWDAAGDLVWLALAPASLDGPLAPRLLSAGPSVPDATPPCAAGPLTWWSLDGRLHLAAGDGAPARPVAGAEGIVEPWRCAGDQLLAVAGDDVARLVLCRPSGCAPLARLPGPRDAAPVLAFAADGAPLLALESHGVLAVWRGAADGGRPFDLLLTALLPAGQNLVGLVDWRGRLTLLTLAGGALRAVPIAPAETIAGR